METLNAITPCARHQSLPRVAESLVPLTARFHLRWVTVFSLHRYPQRHGADERNEALEMIRDGWVWFLDDDNRPHPAFADTLADAIRQHPEADGFVFAQQRADGRILPARVDAGPEEIDTAQYVFRRSAIGPVRWDYAPAHDHSFFAAVRERARNIIAIDTVATYHNGL